MSRLLEIYDQLKDSLSETVKIDNIQIRKVIIRDLRSKRNYCFKIGKMEDVEHFDFVLKYYMGEKDFQKYVIDMAEILP